MNGNEIILNMSNVDYFRVGELVSSLTELTKRLNRKENEEFKDRDLREHPYIGKVLEIYKKKILSFNVNCINSRIVKKPDDQRKNF